MQFIQMYIPLGESEFIWNYWAEITAPQYTLSTLINAYCMMLWYGLLIKPEQYAINKDVKDDWATSLMR